MAGPFLGPDLHAVGREFQTGAPVRLPVDDDEAVEADADSAEQSAGSPLDAVDRQERIPPAISAAATVWPGSKAIVRSSKRKTLKS